MVDKVTTEVIRRGLEYAAEEMGVKLRNAAYSPNIKERMDHSCAIFDSSGSNLAQAEHIPLHLGSMGWGVKRTLNYLLRKEVELYEGDIVIVNYPYISGTHLNDVLTIAPLFLRDELIAYTASKAHYVDIGGKVPGSLASDSTELHEEGLIIPPIKVVDAGELRRDILNLILRNVRSPEVIKGDLMAQIAACDVGGKRVRELALKYGVDVLKEAFKEIIDYSEALTRASLLKLPDFNVKAQDYLEDVAGGDAVINVKVFKEGDTVRIDFTDSSPQVPAPVNAPLGVTLAAATFTIKSVTDPELPINEGFYRRVLVNAPEGSIVNATYPAPVAASIETAQRIVDTVYLALSKAIPEKVPAASCGSMNNILIGGGNSDGEGGTWAFYETIACGYGGRRGLEGVDAVHCNMTNTMNTPIEVIEAELPLQVTRYELRPSSGGAGEWRGGMGVIRSFKLLNGKAKLTVIGERVKHRPWGLEEGHPGKPASYYIVKASTNEVLQLRSKATVILQEGDEVVVETAGGGGYGDPFKRDSQKVLQDYLDGLVTDKEAREDYGIIIKGRKILKKNLK